MAFWQASLPDGDVDQKLLATPFDHRQQRFVFTSHLQHLRVPLRRRFARLNEPPSYSS